MSAKGTPKRGSPEAREPVGDGSLELVGGEAREGIEQHRHDCSGSLLVRGGEVVREQRLDNVARGELRVGGCLLAETLQDEECLHVGGLLAPERSVVVDHRDALRRRDVMRPALRRDALEVADDLGARGAVMPRGKHQCPAVSALSSFATTWSIVKLAAFCRGGNSVKVARNCDTSAVAASTM